MISEEGSEKETKFELEDTQVTSPESPQIQCGAVQDDQDEVAAEGQICRDPNQNTLRMSTPEDSAPDLKPTFCLTAVNKEMVHELVATTPLCTRSAPNTITIPDETPTFALGPSICTQSIQYCPSPPDIRAATKPLPLLPAAAFKRASQVSAERRRRRRNSIHNSACSTFCEEEEAIFPSRRWRKPLADMGDAVTWKLGVINRINAIQY